MSAGECSRRYPFASVGDAQATWDPINDSTTPQLPKENFYNRQETLSKCCLLVLRVGNGVVVAGGELVEHVLVAVELAEGEEEADRRHEGDDGEDTVCEEEARGSGSCSEKALNPLRGAATPRRDCSHWKAFVLVCTPAHATGCSTDTGCCSSFPRRWRQPFLSSSAGLAPPRQLFAPANFATSQEHSNTLLIRHRAD